MAAPAGVAEALAHVRAAVPDLDGDGRLQGVIDARAVFETYPGASPELARRALFYHRLGPWHEVVHGQETGDDAWIETGLAGVIDRLPQEPGAAR